MHQELKLRSELSFKYSYDAQENVGKIKIDTNEKRK